MYLYMELIRMRTKQILLFGLVTCSLTGNMACKDADSEKTLCIDNVRMISRVTGDPLPGDTLLNPNNTGPDFDVYGTDLGLMWHMDGNRVDSWISGGSGPHELEKLKPGSYVIVEEAAPDGYLAAEPVSFVLEAKQEVQTVTMRILHVKP